MARTAESQTFSWPDEVYFHPWVGRYYDDGVGPNNRRLLIVGESHYDKNGDLARQPHEHVTIRLIEELSSEKITARFFTSVAQAVEGRKKYRIDLAALWESVAFYNFIPAMLGQKSEKPTREMIQNGRQVFSIVGSTLRPDCVLIVSARMWDSWIQKGVEVDPLEIGNASHPCREINFYDVHTSLCTWMYHPAVPGFGNAVDYHPILRALLAH